MIKRKCTCEFKDHPELDKLMYQLKEGLVAVHDVAAALDTDIRVLDYHYKYHVAHMSSKDLVKIVMKVKSDLLDVYESLQQSFTALKDAKEPHEVKLKIEISKEIRSLKKDLDEFIRKHSARIAVEHQDLEKQWKKMSEYFAHDACPECRKGLLEFLQDEDVD